MAKGTGRTVLGAGLLALGLLAAACSSDDGGAATKRTTTTAVPTVRPDDALKLDQIQVIGTHNSFHVAADPKERALLRAQNPEQAAQREYSHPSLTTQLGEEKVRQIELDVFADGGGGLYADPAFRRQAGLGPYDAPGMSRPGTKVLHEQDVDYHSVCPVFVDCLREVKRWSDRNPEHVPIAINVQFKDGPLIFDVPDQAAPEKWTPAAMDGLDREILSVFDRTSIVTPDSIRGRYPTLEAAVLAHNWPTLGAVRGKVMFLMINGEPYRTSYRDGHPNLEGRILFTNAEPGQPDASYIGVDDPIGDAAKITDLVRKGYLVRTRADSPDQDQCHTGDTTERDAALKSGAQWISTDYPGPDGARKQCGTTYQVELPGFLAARCNPVTAPTTCTDSRVEPEG